MFIKNKYIKISLDVSLWTKYQLHFESVGKERLSGTLDHIFG